MTAFLFIHGWATDSVVWNDTAKAVAGPDWGLNPFNLNINLPGHGGKGSWDEPSFVPAVREAAERLANFPERSVVGVGWSLGAQILLSAIKEGAQFKGLSPFRGCSPFKGLVLVGATPRFTSGADWTHGQSKALVRRMIQDMKKAPEAALKRFYELNFTPGELKTPEAAAFVNRYKYPGPFECQAGMDNRLPGCFPSFNYAGITAALEALYQEDLRDALGAVKCPCLVVHGDKDAVCPVEAGRFLAENIKGARLEVFTDCGHAPFLTHGELFTRLVKEFAEKL
ncbi:MAG: alpha/beta fold hydrolase [Deltaproteobacteria bacterium]|nr:alpha/beta fold hydrolase [Deltaproteobacteria bacterium]